MDKNIATLLGIEHNQLPHFRVIMAGHVEQPVITHLAAHFGVAGGAVEYDVQFSRVLARGDGFDDCFRFEKIEAKELCRLDLEVFVGDGDDLLFLRSARANSLLFHQLLEARHIHG